MINIHRTPKIDIFRETLNSLRHIDKRLSPERYYVCAGDVITLIPVKSSRHLHTHIFKDFETLDDYTKALELLRSLGFKIFENCRAVPEQ